MSQVDPTETVGTMVGDLGSLQLSPLGFAKICCQGDTIISSRAKMAQTFFFQAGLNGKREFDLGILFVRPLNAIRMLLYL